MAPTLIHPVASSRQLPDTMVLDLSEAQLRTISNLEEEILHGAMPRFARWEMRSGGGIGGENFSCRKTSWPDDWLAADDNLQTDP